MQSIETEDVLYKVLNDSAELKANLSGGIYVQGERPDGSELEDIVVNTISLTHGLPQTGTSNVNIHVSDKPQSIKGRKQRKANRERLRELTALVLSALNMANVPGLTFWVETETIIKEPEISQHYNNLRIGWNIQVNNLTI